MTKKRYKSILYTFLVASVIFTVMYYIYYVRSNIPDDIYVEPYSTEQIRIDIPFVGTMNAYDENGSVAVASVNLMDYFEINSAHQMNYTMQVKLFGLITVKEVNVTVKEPESVIACGIPVGIYIETDGILVVDIGNVNTNDGKTVAPAKGILAPGDYITEIDGKKLTNKNELVTGILENENDYIDLTIDRGGQVLHEKIKPAKDTEGLNKIGVWIRDDCQGLGTLTYISKDKEFGALGHAICEENTGRVVSLNDGKLYTAKIWSIIKGKSGDPGEVVGSINYGDNTYLGDITENTVIGIYGTSVDNVYAYVDEVYMKTAYKQDVKTGPAIVRTFVSGEIKDYEIYIKDLSYAEKDRNKGITFCVTDEDLLEITNGIVQGMSGSPILQNGKVVGAVTHVLVDEPDMGYGIFIENMLEH